ncbi:MFS transporter [uncultured Clostridium sp.]|uniref:MFS transporter n=1 Tax=uncultured Clostridium sp. TaxID=59620 RepID=UPI00262EA0D8|nr:MFS transporter [uncultured Clostridium sp.]
MKHKIKSLEERRMSYNILLFTIVFALVGGVKSIVGDAYRSYLRLSNKAASDDLSMLIGFAMLILVIALLAVKWFGHKKVFIAIAISMLIAFILPIYFHSYLPIAVSSAVLHLGDKAFDIMMALVIMAYTNKDNRIMVFTRVIIINVIVEAVVSMFDGKLVVWRFKQLLGVSYDKADKLTAHTSKMTPDQLASYIESYKFVLWIAVAILVAIIILLAMMKEKREDYRGVQELTTEKIEKVKFDKSVFKNKYIVSWVIYSVAMGVESNFITPNLAIYFNRILHISRGATSTILSFKSIGMLVFLLATPFIVKKMGNIKSFALLIFLSGPVMIVIGMGNIFLPATAMVMGAAIFLRYGFTHAVHPVQDSLQLLLVKKENRPVFLAIITGINAVISIIIGFFGAKTLFNTARGYHMLFFGFAIVFILCGIMLYVVFDKKYNKTLEY